MMRPRIPLVLLASSAFCAATGAWSSGRLPPMPVLPRQFADFAACLAHLEETARADRAGTETGAVPVEGGKTRRKITETKGIEHLGPDSARYEARVGYEFRFPNREKGYIETTFSYEETRLDCRGGEMTGTVTKGFMLPGHERM